MIKILDVKNLNVTFSTQHQRLHAVRDVNFDLYEGETLGIVGESGSGKSAMAKALIQLIPSSQAQISGQILLKTALSSVTSQYHDLSTYTEKQMQQIRGKEMSMIFQDPMTSLNPTMKIGEQIIEGYRCHFPSKNHLEAYHIAVEMLDMVGITDPKVLMHHYPHTLSGGMRQRVMIAIALCCKPQILLADEPTTALDVTIQAQILNLIQDLQKQNQTSMLLITHDLSVVAKCCDRVLVMYAGKVIESATVYDLFAHPQHPYTQRLLQAIPKLNQSPKEPLIPIEGMPPNLSFPLLHCGFCARCPSAMHICAQQSPPLFPVGTNHLSACFTHDPRYQK